MSASPRPDSYSAANGFSLDHLVVTHEQRGRCVKAEPLSRRSRLAQIMILQWQRANALTGGGKDRVAECGRYHRRRRFADPAPEPAARHDDDFHLRHLG